jgi:2-polyprenyl-3-methyl-5-hydroxy-6-metoxy-1,4-benzoquinol methylase
MPETDVIIDNAITALFSKLEKLNPLPDEVSEYNKNYLMRYIDNYTFYMGLYRQLFKKAIDKLTKPVADSVFVDYGGGCGMLSYLAKEIGFKTVVYNDIYPVSVSDACIIAKSLNIHIDHYIAGDIKTFVSEINSLNIKPDLVCSFDVLEHIYDWRSWIKEITNINSFFSLLFMTSANARNPFINQRLKKIQLQAEHKGFEKDAGWKESDLNTSFLEERKKIIAAKFSDLKQEEINMLAKKTRGLIKEDIEKLVEAYIASGKITYQPEHPTNTCDPYTGNWAEHLINTDDLKSFSAANNFFVEITNTVYGYSKNKLLNIPKRIMNAVIKLTGKNNLFFSPMYVLEMSKR